MKNKFYNKDGTLTAYALACGYIETSEKNDIKITLWKEGCFHVRKHDFNKGIRIFWKSFDNLTSARKFFNKNK